MFKKNRLVVRIFFIKWLSLFLLLLASQSVSAGLFGYRETQRTNLEMFPQWLSVLARHIQTNIPEGNCETRRLDSCHLKRWHLFLKSISNFSEAEKIQRVNEFANNQQYILDIENYGMEDYWAAPRQFLYNNGDCEDYAITKMLSLKYLGFTEKSMRLVVLQDTNLRIPHAVLAVYHDGDALIMDNQIEEVVSHKNIVHYVPIYSVSESKWWMYLPD